MGFDDIIIALGTLSRWHRITIISSILIFVCQSQHIVSTVFYQAIPKFRCVLPNEDKTSDYKISDDAMENNYPIDNVTNVYSTCKMFNNQNQSDTIDCVEFIYDRSEFQETSVVLYEMVCKRSYLLATADALFMTGYLIGATLGGGLSDKYGRKPVLFICLFLQFSFGVLTIFANFYPLYVFAKFMDGIATASALTVAFVLVTETVITKHRLFAGEVTLFACALGYGLVALYAYYIRHWQYLLALVCAPGPVFILYWFFLTESPRWLIITRRYARATKTIKFIAKMNRVDLAEVSLDTFEWLRSSGENIIAEQPTQKTKMSDLCRYKRLRNMSFVLFLSWMSIAMTYYGITFISNELSGNIYLNFFLAAVAESISYALILLTVNRWGRRIMYAGSMLIAGVLLICVLFVPEDMGWLNVLLTLSGKCASCYAFGLAYTYSMELYPTVIRNSGLGLCSTCGRIGTILAPYIILLRSYWKALPMVIFGVLMFVSGIGAFTLPETLNKKLADTLQEAEDQAADTPKDA